MQGNSALTSMALAVVADEPTNRQSKSNRFIIRQVPIILKCVDLQDAKPLDAGGFQRVNVSIM